MAEFEIEQELVNLGIRVWVKQGMKLKRVLEKHMVAIARQEV